VGSRFQVQLEEDAAQDSAQWTVADKWSEAFARLQRQNMSSNVYDRFTRNRRQNRYEKTSTGMKTSDASDIQFGTDLFWYPFLVTNRTCIVPVVWYGFSAPISGTCVMDISRR